MLGFVLLSLLVLIVLLQQSDRRQFEATFLQQCSDAGYDPAKCRFFLTMSGRSASTEVMREIVLVPK